MALAICDSALHPAARPGATRPGRSPHRRRGRHRSERCRVVRRRQCLAGLVVVALGTGGFVVATEAVAGVGRLVIDAPASPAPAEGNWAARPVAPGESLWSIAAASSPEGDIRRSVDELVRINGGSAIQAGELVRIPASWADDR